MRKLKFGRKIKATTPNIEQTKSGPHTQFTEYIAGIIRSTTERQFETCSITTEEVINVIHDLVEEAKTNVDFMQIAINLNEFLQPIKKYKRVPLARGPKAILACIGTEKEKEPESLKNLRNKCNQAEKINSEIESIKKTRDKRYL